MQETSLIVGKERMKIDVFVEWNWIRRFFVHQQQQRTLTHTSTEKNA